MGRSNLAQYQVGQLAGLQLMASLRLELGRPQELSLLTKSDLVEQPTNKAAASLPLYQDELPFVKCAVGTYRLECTFRYAKDCKNAQQRILSDRAGVYACDRRQQFVTYNITSLKPNF